MSFYIKDQELDESTHVIELAGELDLYTAPDFKQLLTRVIDSGKSRVVVDMTEATFIDSTTLGVLVSGLKRLRPNGGSLVLVCSLESILEVFEVTGLDSVFSIHPTREDALAELADNAANG